MIGPYDNLYPAIKPYKCGRLQVSELHELYYEECGNPEGKPVAFVHGGPGTGCKPEDRQFFDPDYYRIILVDQRGAGRSSPRACVEENTIQDLIRDLELLRETLDIEKWMLFGGSWGSALSLAYSQKYPENISEMILHGIFLSRKEEFEWFYQTGTPLVFPEAAEHFHSFLDENERCDVIGAYHRRITGPDEDLKRESLEAWARWEAETSSLIRNEERIEKFSDPEYAETFAGIELHYFVNGGFLKYNGQLLTEADRIENIPGVIIHGRYDMVCPVENAVLLKKKWQVADLNIIPDAGHSSDEPGIRAALINATDKFKQETL